MSKPYEGFEQVLYEPHGGLIDAAKYDRAAKLLNLSPESAEHLRKRLQGISGWYHGNPTSSKTRAELQAELDSYASALFSAERAWAGLSFGAKQLLAEVYLQSGGRRQEHESHLSPQQLRDGDGAIISRAADFAYTTLRCLKPSTTGPAPTRASELAKYVLATIENILGHVPSFGSAKRQGGTRTIAYKACCLAMQAIDHDLTIEECEGPLERALRDRPADT